MSGTWAGGLACERFRLLSPTKSEDKFQLLQVIDILGSGEHPAFAPTGMLDASAPASVVDV